MAPDESTIRKSVAAYFELLNGENWDDLAALFAEDAELTAPGTRPRRGREAVRDYFRDALRPWPDHRDTPTRVIVADGTATVEVHFEGGLENGQTLAFDAVDVFDVGEDGLFTRLSSWYDSYHVRQRLAKARAHAGPALDPGAEPPWLGSVSEATAERLLAALWLVRRGTAFRLDLPLDQPDPPLYGREPMRHTVYGMEGFELVEDDMLDRLNTQAGSQWDALRHFRSPQLHRYGDRSPEDLGIDLWARGIYGRGVLLDLAALGMPPDRRYDITPGEVEECAKRQGVELRAGDVVLLRTGWLSWLLGLVSEERPEEIATPGLAPTEETVEWLRSRRFAGVAADNPGLEAVPGTPEPELLHGRMLPDLGLAVGELFWLEELCEDCKHDGVWEGLLMSVPLNLPAGCASPANVVLFK